jgi:hypothetical protein
MKRTGWSGLTTGLVAALIWATLPAAPARAETGDSSVGAAVTIGLMATVVVVYALVTLRSDVERYSEAGSEGAIVRAARMAEESPVVLQAVTAPIGLGAPGAGTQTEVAGAAVGWRVCF